MISYAKLVIAGVIASLFCALLLYSYVQNKQLKATQHELANAETELENKTKECRNNATAYNAIGMIKSIEGAYHETNTTADDNTTVTVNLDRLWSND